MTRRQYLIKMWPVRKGMFEKEPTAREKHVMEEHRTYVAQLRERGYLTLAGNAAGTTAGGFEMLIVATESPDELREIVDNDPAVKSRVLQAQSYTFDVTTTLGQ